MPRRPLTFAERIKRLAVTRTAALSGVPVLGSVAFDDRQARGFAAPLGPGTVVNAAFHPEFVKPEAETRGGNAGAAGGNHRGAGIDGGEGISQLFRGQQLPILIEQAGQWPDLITSPSDLYEPIRQCAFAKVFRFLFNTNDSDRSQILFNLHQDRYEKTMKELTARFDRDGTGLPSSENREAVMRSYHPGGAPRRYARRDPRW